ncbi:MULTISPECIES: 5-formyltetrahydrofolate cyclo-ligase [unclassified Streptomyces]|uniref:5-formyltetrahydrofolate cyclo-ligase n=1 Tax=unclassified Streptomyces TaxID=2593676 RepID=UPI0021564554|nr:MULTISPECIES: 5-formyltetrahydrofolate cyclo-ligase [unclassified Streptomyces]
MDDSMAIAVLKRQVRRDLLAVRAAMADDELEHAATALTEQALALPELTAARTVAAYVAVGHEPETRPLIAALHERGTRVLLPVLLPDDDLDWAQYQGEDSLVEAEHPGRIRLYEPAGARLGRHAVTEADVVLLPGLAVDGRGVRMGRGGGSYDRALARLAVSDTVTGAAEEAGAGGTAVNGTAAGGSLAGGPVTDGPVADSPVVGGPVLDGPVLDGPAAGGGPGGRALLMAVVYGHEIVGHLPDEPHDQPVHAALTPEGVHRFPG